MSRNSSINLRYWAITSQCRYIPRLSRRYLHAAAEETSPSTKHTVNPYPYPAHRNPTPHQLFHLPVNATKSEIKARYYDLVRLYHPDKVSDSMDPTVALARFRAITVAYDALRGKTPLNHNPLHDGPSNSEARYRTTASYRAMRQRRQELYSSSAVDDSTKDKIILAGVIMTIVFVIVHTATTRRDAIAEALDRSRSFSASRQHNKKPTEDHRLSQDQPSDTTS